MKSVTSYFALQNNTLNKGYDTVKDFEKKDKLEGTYKFPFVGDINVISAYEEIYPGSLKLILELAKTEQVNQYKLEKEKIAKKVKISLWGNIFGFLTCCAICATTVKILLMHLQIIAVIFAVTSFTCIFGISILMNLGFLKQKKKFYPGFPPRKNFHYSKNKKQNLS